METVNTVSLLATVYDSKLSFPSILLPFYLNAVPAPVKRRCHARFFSESHRIVISHSAGHSVVNRLLGNKKSRYIQMVCTDRK